MVYSQLRQSTTPKATLIEEATADNPSSPINYAKGYVDRRGYDG
ncbi:MAG: hypothetical protein RLO17_13725 [Cyclobacteriaceae bacterium]